MAQEQRVTLDYFKLNLLHRLLRNVATIWAMLPTSSLGGCCLYAEETALVVGSPTREVENSIQISLMDFNYTSLLPVKYVDGKTPSLDVHYRKWNYDGPTAEIILMPQKEVTQKG